MNNKKYALGLDISTSNIGFCLINKSNLDLVDIGVLNLKKINDIFEKVDFFKSWLLGYKYINNTDIIVIEAPLKRFAPGKSNANTLFNLYSFNMLLQYVCKKEFLDIEQIVYNVMSARKGCSIIVPKGLKYKERKHFIFEKVNDIINYDDWTYSKFNNLKDENYDMADAFVIVYGYLKRSG